MRNCSTSDRCNGNLADEKRSENSSPNSRQHNLAGIRTRISGNNAKLLKDREARRLNEPRKIRNKCEAPMYRDVVHKTLGSSRSANADTNPGKQAGMNCDYQGSRHNEELGKRHVRNIPKQGVLSRTSSDSQLGYLAGWDAKVHNDQAQNLEGSKNPHPQDSEERDGPFDIVLGQPKNSPTSRQALSKTSAIPTSSRSTSVAPSTDSNSTGELQRKERIGAESGSVTTPENEAGVTSAVPKPHERNVRQSADTTNMVSPISSQEKLPYIRSGTDSYASSNINQVNPVQNEDSARSPLPREALRSSKRHEGDINFRSPPSPSSLRHTAAGYPSCSNCGKKLLASTSRVQNPLCAHCKAAKQSRTGRHSPTVPETPQISVDQISPEDEELTIQPANPLPAADLFVSKSTASPAVSSKRQIPAPSYDSLFHKNKKPRVSNKPVPVNYTPFRKARATDGHPINELLRPSTPLGTSPDSPGQSSRTGDEPSPQRGKLLELDSIVRKERLQSEALREELRKTKSEYSAIQKTDRLNFDIKLQQQKQKHENDIELASVINEEERAQSKRELESEQEARKKAEERAEKLEQEKLSVKELFESLTAKSPSRCDTDDEQHVLQSQIEQMKAEGVQFEEDSDSDSCDTQPIDVTKQGIGPTSCRQQSCSGLTEIFPGYFSTHFDREAKLAEIAARPRRKKTFKRVLPLWHSGRECAPPQQAFDVLDETILSFTTLRRKANRGGPGTDDAEEDIAEDFGTWSEFIGMPKTLVPTLTKEKELAFRDAIRDANGRLPRAREIFKVHDKNAARLV